MKSLKIVLPSHVVANIGEIKKALEFAKEMSKKHPSLREFALRYK